MGTTLVLELQDILLQVSLCVDVCDRTIWKFHSSRRFSVKSFTSMISSKQIGLA